MNLELLREARDYLATIPDEQIDLQYYIKSIDFDRWANRDRLNPCETACRTIACGLGWLCLHPKFSDSLVNAISIDGHVEFKDPHLPYFPAARLFDIDVGIAENLFARRGYSAYDKIIYLRLRFGVTELSDKQMLLARFDILLGAPNEVLE